MPVNHQNSCVIGMLYTEAHFDIDQSPGTLLKTLSFQRYIAEHIVKIFLTLSNQALHAQVH